MNRQNKYYVNSTGGKIKGYTSHLRFLLFTFYTNDNYLAPNIFRKHWAEWPKGYKLWFCVNIPHTLKFGVFQRIDEDN